MNTPISFELAKLLKEKEFDKPTPSFYFKNGEIGYGQLYNWNGSHNSTDISRPTIAEVVMWLYEKHDIWIYAHKEGGWWFPVIENYYDEDDQGTIIEDLEKMVETIFNSPTEAYEAAIEYTLNNLI